MAYLLFLETSGNQAYLYATNRLKESIGASELTYRTGTRWLLQAVEQVGGPTGLWAPEGLDRVALRQGQRRNGIEVILATSGKGLVLVQDQMQARDILRKVSETVLREAPGLDVCGAIVPLHDESDAGFARAYHEVHERYNQARNLMPSPVERYPMLPGVQACASSGHPAERSQTLHKVGSAAFSAATLKKREAASAWFERMGQLIKTQNQTCQGAVQLSSSVDKLEKDFEGLDWVGVIFADGNGLGQLFMNFEKYLQGKPYARTLREFSIAIDECTEAAFYSACRTMGDTQVPVVPLVLGGDDLTLVMDGRRALDFAVTFLREFERETSEKPIITELARAGLGAPRLSACAGVAIVKPHFPFHAAQVMAEELLQSAKTVKQHVISQRPGHGHDAYPCSALDFHVLYDSTFHSLALLRSKRRTHADKGRQYRLYGGPYVTTPEQLLRAPAERRLLGTDWARDHSVQALLDRVYRLQARDDEGRHLLPNSQMHALREALSQGRDAADSFLTGLLSQYGQSVDVLIETPAKKDGQCSLFRPDKEKDGDDMPTLFSTRFLDALSSSEFWQPQGDQTTPTPVPQL